LLLLGLRLGRERGKVSSLLLVLKARRLVTSIAEGLVLGVSASAKRNILAPGKAVGLAVHVDQFDGALNAQGPVISHDNLRHEASL
jgi:hypothetical protein